MSGGMKYRLVAFVLAIAGMFVLIAWTAHTSWRRGGELREKLTTVQLQSFQIADHLQQTIWELNNLVLRYGVYHDTNDWTRFESVSKELDKWIDDQRPILSTEKERQILDLINTNYDDYMAAARQHRSQGALQHPAGHAPGRVRRFREAVPAHPEPRLPTWPKPTSIPWIPSWPIPRSPSPTCAWSC